ncbi:MAG: fibronectin type III domain-containing protein [Vicinamibacterales bacterium]
MGSRIRVALVLTLTAAVSVVPAAAQSVPDAPGPLSAQVVGNGVTLSWGASFPPPTSYLVEVGSTPGLSDLGMFAVGPVTTLPVAGVPTGNYFVRVRAANGIGTSAPTPDVVVTVGAACQLPAAPAALAATVVGTAVTLQWTGTGPFRLIAGHASGTADVFAGDVGSTPSLAAAVAAGAYYVRVHARNNCGLSLASNEVVLHVQVPEAPTGLASSVIGDQLRLLWNSAAPGVAPTSYVLEAGTAPRLANIATLPLAALPTRFDVSNVPAGTYYVRVRGATPQAAGPASSDLAFTVGPPLPGTTAVTFASLPGTNGTPFTSHSEQGLLVEPISGDWTVLASYGRPAPSIQLVRPLFDTEVSGSVRVTAGGSTFRLSSVDLYSSVTPIPYVLTGTLGGAPVFSVVATVPNTFGNFATVANPHSTALIDTLLITVTNPATPSCPTCGGNPVGIDNIVVWP